MHQAHLPSRPQRRLPLALAISAALTLVACGGHSGNDSAAPLVLPAAPASQGAVDTTPLQSGVPAMVDTIATNQRGDARYATLATNAGVRVLAGMLDIWTPLTQIVDAGVTAPAVGAFPAVTASAWTGLPSDGTAGGTIVNPTVHNANIAYAVNATSNRTAAQATAAYLDDRRNKGYSVTDGMGPLTAAWRTAAQQTTSITAVAADATTVLYNDSGNNLGVGGSANAAFGAVVDLISALGNNASTEPAKRFYKYARPYRWSSSVLVLPALVPAESATPATDGGFNSGHSAEATRDVIGMAYAVPQRYQEILSRGLELGENRILAGMHSPLDVIGGRVQAQALAAANLYDSANAAKKAAAVSLARSTLMAAAGVSTDAALLAYAHSGTTATDRFADYATNKANYLRRLTYGFAQSGGKGVPAVVPKGAEVLLETRLPYLSADQRRVVLKSTALDSGYPLLDDAEGWGRLNLFAAADGYGALVGDVTVTMDATLGGFYASDLWRNDISGTGQLIKAGSGALGLVGANTYSGGTRLTAGTLFGVSPAAFGLGDVYVGGGTLVSNATAGALAIAGRYTQLAGSTLELDLGSGQRGRLAVSGVATIGGGTLHITFPNGYQPANGDILTVLSGDSLVGKFDSITADGYSVTPTYSASGLQLQFKL